MRILLAIGGALVFALAQSASALLLTSGSRDVLDPRATNSITVWRAYDGSDYEIIEYDGTHTPQLTNNGSDDLDPAASGTAVVWRELVSSHYQIMLWNGTTTIPLTNDSHDNLDPRVSQSGSNVAVVWRHFDGNHYQIMYSWNGGTPIQLTTSTRDDFDPQVSIWGSLVNVVWREFDGSHYQIMRWDGTTTISLSNNNFDNLSPQVSTYPLPGVSNEEVIWRGFDGSHYQIMISEGGSPPGGYDMTSNGYHDNFHDAFDGSILTGQVAIIVCRLFDFDNHYHVFYTDGGRSNGFITDSPDNVHDDLDLQAAGVFGDAPAGAWTWRQFDGSDYEIWDQPWSGGGSSYQLTNNSHDDLDPRTSGYGMKTAWREYDGYAMQLPEPDRWSMWLAGLTCFLSLPRTREQIRMSRAIV